MQLAANSKNRSNVNTFSGLICCLFVSIAIFITSKLQKTTVSKKKLTEILHSTRMIIAGNKEHPFGDTGYRKEIDSYHHLSKYVRKMPWGKVIGGIMLCLIGTAIIVASGVIALASFGVLAPINMLGIVLGVSMVVGGVATAIGGTVGMGSIIGGSILFFKVAQKNPLAHEMKLTESAARERYGFEK
jgi:hypothetical protein